MINKRENLNVRVIDVEKDKDIFYQFGVKDWTLAV